jgi:cephalosporin-C deacetylase
MPITDMPLPELKSYRPPLTRAEDFDTFWKENVEEAGEQPLTARSREVLYFTKKIRVEEVTFDGFMDRSPIVGYFISAPEPGVQRPTLVQYHGYSGNKGHPTDYLGWVLLGFSVFAVDVRGQGGQSADYARYEPGNMKGHMMKGIGDKFGYYFRFAYMDCYRAVSYALGRKDVDGNRVGVMGSSQGGGLSIAMAALHSKVAVVMSGVPYLCDF